MEKKRKRVYVYEDTYKKIMEWGKWKQITDNTFKSPNNRENFPYFLEKLAEGVKNGA